MTRHPALAEGLLDRLRAVVGVDPPPGSPARGPVALAKGAAKSIVRKGIAWYVDPVAHHTAQEVSRAVVTELTPPEHLGTLSVNLELLKGEFREILATVEDLGRAIAPDAGLAAATERMSELRESVRALEQQVRTLRSASPTSPVAAAPGAPTPTQPGAPPATATTPGFDYTGFERRFRGSPEEILDTLRERYFDDLAEAGSVLDVGCGRGELVTALAEMGLETSGVDSDPDMVAEARRLGARVELGDALAHLRSLPEASLGAVVAIQVVEHLPFARVVELVELVRSRLRPGGLFVAETPNPASLVVLGNSFILDPTHERPLHPSLLGFLCESTGYRSVELRYWAPAEDYWLPTVADDDAPEWVDQVNQAFQRLNTVLFGPQDYAVLARTPS